MLLVLLSSAIFSVAFSQNVGIGTALPDNSAKLDITSTDKGMLIPRMTTTQRAAIVSPAKGLIVFDSTMGSMWFYDKNWKQLTTTATSDNDLAFKKNAPTTYIMTANQNINDSAGYIYDSGGPGGLYGKCV